MDFSKVSDDKIKSATKKTWKQWVMILDRFGAKKHGHRETARYLRARLGLSDWWSQFVVIRYEKEKRYWRRSGTWLRHQRQY